jgi:hypothetical protein
MLSALYNSAKRLFTPIQFAESIETGTKVTPDERMVTTRGQQNAVAKQSAEGSSTRNNLPVRAKGVKRGSETIVVEVPVGKLAQEQIDGKHVVVKELIQSTDFGEKAMVKAEDEGEQVAIEKPSAEAGHPSSIIDKMEGEDGSGETDATARGEAAIEPATTIEVEIEEPVVTKPSITLEISDSEETGDVDEISKKHIPNKKASRSPVKSSQAPQRTPSTTSPSSTKPKHKRFGSDEPESVEFLSTAPVIVNSEEESSDDEVEEITVKDAGKIAAAMERDAAKAAEE